MRGLGCSNTTDLPTAGQEDENITSLAWAALKTGGRFVAAWTSPGPTEGKLEFSVDNAAVTEAAEPEPRATHVFILEGLPVNSTLCFRASHQESNKETQSDWHMVRLANAMNAFDPLSSTYSVNLLALANHVPNRQDLEYGFDVFADALNDASDGHVVAGQQIVLYDYHEEPLVLVAGRTATGTVHYDVLFQYDYPYAAGYTSRDGIRNSSRFIVMNSFWEAHTLGIWDPEEIGMVLLHELGHYAFGAQDLYTTAGQGPDCYDATTSISVMGSDRRATEYDDEVNRCANEELLSEDYVPTWTKLRERYPLIPDRFGVIDEGPDGSGEAYGLAVYDAGLP